jgi:hypothetical protein
VSQRHPGDPILIGIRFEPWKRPTSNKPVLRSDWINRMFSYGDFFGGWMNGKSLNDTDEPVIFGEFNIAWPKGWAPEQAQAIGKSTVSCHRRLPHAVPTKSMALKCPKPRLSLWRSRSSARSWGQQIGQRSCARSTGYFSDVAWARAGLKSGLP